MINRSVCIVSADTKFLCNVSCKFSMLKSCIYISKLLLPSIHSPSQNIQELIFGQVLQCIPILLRYGLAIRIATYLVMALSSWLKCV